MAMIPSGSIDPLLQLLIDFAKKEGALVFGVEDKIEDLKERMQRVRSVLIDAERRQFLDTDIKTWLDELRDIMYDAQDIIDDSKILAEKHDKGSSSSPSSSSASVSCFRSLFSCVPKVAIKHDIGKRIQSLNQRLDKILKDIELLKLTEIGYRDNDGNPTRITAPLVDPDIVGSTIEEDTKKLVGLLTKEHQQRKIVIYGIVGMGGIGKTTLAQKIFNDNTLRANFQETKPIWVCVSKDNYDEIRILKSIIKGAGGDPSQAGDKGELQNLLFEVVRQKRLFLVLDDVWNAQACDELLRTPISSASTGSRILVTTRYEGIAMEMGATFRHNVAKLSDEDGWSLLRKMVLLDEEEQQVQTLRDVGIQIVKKCDGLPLAIRAIGGLLRTKEARPSEWEKILRDLAWSSIPKGVMAALYLSYEDLPPHLKQCFVYLALFPEDYELYREQLTDLWIAEGFVEANDGNLLEEKADEYCNELIERSFLQPHYVYLGVSYKLHDILRDLAQSLAGKECRCVNAEVKIDFTQQEKTRRLHINDASASFLRRIKDKSSLRTLICEEISAENEIPEEVSRTFKHLKILSLCGRRSIEKLPDSLLRLMHLRLLDLSWTKIIQIPESIGSLKCLQFLLLDGCQNLQRLPTGIGSFTDLRCLTMRGTAIDRILKAIARLPHIRTLEPFILSGSNIVEEQGHGRGEWCTLEDLKHLKLLRTVTIRNLERSSSAAEAKAAELENKSHLIQLTLECSRTTTYNEESTARIVQVFDELRPPSCIEEITIAGYFGKVLPKWFRSSTPFPYLTKLSLFSCILCERLPPFGLLPNLTYLLVEDMQQLKTVGPELLLPVEDSVSKGDDVRHHTPFRSFPKLKELHFVRMGGWEEWSWLEEEGSLQAQMVLLPQLKLLRLCICPRLRSLPHILLNHATRLEELETYDMHNLRAIESLRHIKKLYISNNHNLNTVANLPSLEYLEIDRCAGRGKVEHLHQLRTLIINLDPEVKSLPEWMYAAAKEGEWPFPNLQLLQIGPSCGVRLMVRCLIDGPEWPIIKDIPRFSARREQRGYETFFIDYTKSPFSFKSNINLGDQNMEDKDILSWPEQVHHPIHGHVLLLTIRNDYHCNMCGKPGGSGPSTASFVTLSCTRNAHSKTNTKDTTKLKLLWRTRPAAAAATSLINLSIAENYLRCCLL